MDNSVVTSMYIEEMDDIFIVEIVYEIVDVPNGKPSNYDKFAEGYEDAVDVIEIKIASTADILESEKSQLEELLDTRKYVEKAERAIIRMMEEESK